MSDSEEVTTPAAEAPAAAPAAAKKKKPSKSKAKKPASHPKFREMVIEAIGALKERGGSSRQAILKYIEEHYEVDKTSGNNHLKMTLRACVKNGTLKQSKGSGASGSFKLGDKGKDKPAKKAKKSTAAAATKKPKTDKKKVSKPKKTKPKTEKKVKASPKKKAAKPKKSPKKAAAAKPKAKKGKAAKK